MKTESGFTFLEMLLVLLIFSLIISIGIPGVRRISAYWELQLAANRLVADIREAQALAMVHSDYHEIRFYLFEPRYFVYEGVKQVRKVEYPAGVDYPHGYLQFPTNYIRFDGTGHVNTGGTIQLVNRYGDRVSVVLYLHTGRVAVTGAYAE